MIRRLALGLVAVALTATALPALAAPKKTTTLYFANTGACGTEQPVYSLVVEPQTAGECSGTYGGYAGNGFLTEDAYTSTKRSTFRLDSTRKVTGTVHVQHFGIINLIPRLPGYATVEVTVRLDSVKLGTKQESGVIMPLESLPVDFSFAIPASLRGKTAKKLTIVVKMIDAVGLTGVSYTDPHASVAMVPVK